MPREENWNCLEGMRCPKCGCATELLIAATAWFRVTDDGTDEYHDVEWDDNSPCRCPVCEHQSTVGEFSGKRTQTQPRKVTIEVYYASVEGQTQTLGTVVVPNGITDDDIGRLFLEWRDLASGETTDPDAEDEGEAYRWCGPDTDSEFIDWLIARRGFRHAEGSGETLTLEW